MNRSTMNRLAASLATATTTLMLSLPASAQFAKTEDAVRYRQSAMFLQGQHFGRIAAMASGRTPFDAATVAANADVLAALVKLPWPAFAPGTEGGKAKTDIWKEQARFKEFSDKLQADTEKLAAAAKGGNLDAIKAQVAQIGDTCKACHDAFRNR